MSLKLLKIYCKQTGAWKDGQTFLYVSVLGREEEYTVKYVPEPKGFPKGNLEGSGTFFTIYPHLSPFMDIIPFLEKDLLSFWVIECSNFCFSLNCINILAKIGVLDFPHSELSSLTVWPYVFPA